MISDKDIIVGQLQENKKGPVEVLNASEDSVKILLTTKGRRRTGRALKEIIEKRKAKRQKGFFVSRLNCFYPSDLAILRFSCEMKGDRSFSFVIEKMVNYPRLKTGGMSRKGCEQLVDKEA